ncbi:MAG: hypothetical protein JXO72_12695 [Vicinamibacteria bacterium]|nr:hypothetical protein [Vicinamibacteria bacterium]
MPELPDLLHAVTRLRAQLVGMNVATERVRAAAALRFTVPGNMSLLLGRRIEDVARHGHFIIVRFEGLDLVMNASAGGRFRLADAGDGDEEAMIFALGIHNPDPARAAARELRLIDKKRTSRTYVTATGDHKVVPGMDAMGVDILSPQFTPERLVSLLKHRQDPVHAMLADKRAIDSLGDVFVDAALLKAGIHPKTRCRDLTHAQALRLHGAVTHIVKNAMDEVSRCESLDVEVHGAFKARMPSLCPRCGAGIRKATIRSREARYCPRCQPSSKSCPTAC